MRVVGERLERNSRVIVDGELFRAYGAVPADANHNGAPVWFAPVG